MDFADKQFPCVCELSFIFKTFYSRFIIFHLAAWNMEQFEQLLTCCVCLDRYRNPKLLPCQHSFCMEPCMEGLVDYVRRQVCITTHRIKETYMNVWRICTRNIREYDVDGKNPRRNSYASSAFVYVPVKRVIVCLEIWIIGPSKFVSHPLRLGGPCFSYSNL